jgi:predicted transcriptional regulator
LKKIEFLESNSLIIEDNNRESIYPITDKRENFFNTNNLVLNSVSNLNGVGAKPKIEYWNK